MIKWYCGGMARRPLRNLPVCSTLHCAELGHSASVAFPRTDRPPIGYEQLFICIYTYHICICVYVCMYVCMYVCIYLNIYIHYLNFIYILHYHSFSFSCVRIDIHLRKALQFSLSFHDTVDSTHRYAKLGCCRSLAEFLAAFRTSKFSDRVKFLLLWRDMVGVLPAESIHELNTTFSVKVIYESEGYGMM